MEGSRRQARSSQTDVAQGSAELELNYRDAQACAAAFLALHPPDCIAAGTGTETCSQGGVELQLARSQAPHWFARFV